MSTPPPIPSVQAPSPAPATPSGVGGWLLLLCVALVLVCPVLVAWLVSTTYAGLDSRLLASGLAHGAVVLSLWLAGVAAALGVHAGLALWAQRPGAVATARRALLWGLALDVAATVLQLLTGTTAFTPSLALDELMVRLLPDLLFFTLCLGYLNKSRRVALTYPA